MNKHHKLDLMETAWDGCTSCKLHERRTRIVHWRGNPEAKLFLVGEAPGASEDKRGLPFVGEAGKLLDELLRECGLDPSEGVFIANQVACRPPGNRTPDRDEIKECSPRLQWMLKTVDPSCLLLLGATAARLAGVYGSVGRATGESDVELYCYDGQVRRWPAVVAYHPAFLLRSTNPEHRQKVKDSIMLARKLANS